MKEKFLENLKRELHKRFLEAEVLEIIAYYEEIIHERLEQGHKIESIIASYDVKEIVKEMAPRYIMKRDHSAKNTMKSTHLLLVILLSTPVLLPVGITYLVLLIVSFSMILTGAILIGSGMFVVLASIFESLFEGIQLADTLLFLGSGFIGSAIMMTAGYVLIIVFRWIIQQLLWVFTKKATNKGGK